jgi:putative hydrolase of the HAD superfamily
VSGGLVLWDFDGTLAERPGMWRGCLVEVLEAHEPGAPADADALIPFLRDGFPWHRPDVAHPELCEPEAWWGHVLPLLSGAYEGIGLAPERAGELAALARAQYVDASAGWRMFDDTVPALELLSERGWRHVILSNHVPELGGIVEGLGLGDVVDDVLCSAVIGYEKPHPEAFAAALRSRRDGDPVWMVGDNPEADVAGACAAGIPAVLVRGEGVGLLEAAEVILTS